MIDSLKRPPGSLRWAPRQRFTLNEVGRQAKASYDSAVVAAHEHGGGRDVLEAAQQAWATVYGLQPGDGLLLDEFARAKATVAQASEALADCGITRPEAQAATDRLFKAGLLEADPLPASAQTV
jgi:hypothetical protein